MFKITTDPRFTHEVKVMVPVDGGHEEQSFKVTFKVVPIDELKEDVSLSAEQNQARHLRQVVCGMADLVGDGDAPLDYSDKLRDQLIAIPYVRIAMMRAYLGAVTKARAGN